MYVTLYISVRGTALACGRECESKRLVLLRASDRVLAKKMHLDDYETCGFACRKCAAMVRIKPRAFEGANEPVSWWWCQACKGESAAVSAVKTVKQKKATQAALGCMLLDAAWGQSAR